MTVEVTGFKKHIQDKVQLQISETRDLPIVLEVGGLEEAVSVTAEGAVLNKSDASLGFTVDSKRIAELPLIHGDPYKIMGLATGLAHSGDQRLDRPYEPTHIVGYAYDGTRSNRSDLLIDGAPSTSTANQNEVIATYVPPSDLVQEFKVQTATFDAQFGNTEGGVTSISIKSGTNRLHGSVYYFAEPKSLAANDYFGNARGQDRPDTSSDRPGFTLTGPVRIPGLYDGRDKTFFTVGFERIKDVRPRFDAPADSWVPTEALRNGDFSAYAGNITIYDPLTRVPSGNQFVGQPFPGNIIPANRISPVSRAILDYYSLPKSAGLNGNIYDSTLPETADYNSFTGRLDQKISNNNKMFVRYSWYNRDSIYNEYLDSEASGTWFQFQSYQAVIDDVHVINPTTVLNVRYGYNRFERNSGQEEDARNFDLTRLGFPAEYNSLVPEVNRYFPRLDFDGNTMIDVAYGNDFRPTTSHTVVATLNKVLAAHSLKGGMEMRIYREDSLSTANAQAGQYAFTNAYTRQSSASGTDYQGLQNYASFLLGMPNTTSILRASDYSEYSKTWGFFVQDDWRVNEKLTLNLGLRYEVETALTERNDKSVSGFDYDYVQPIEPTVQARYAALNDPALKALQSAAERQGRPPVRRRRRPVQPPVRDAEEHLPAALRLRLPAELEDGHPRRRRALRRLPRPAPRRRVPERLGPDDHRRHGQQRVRGPRPEELGHGAPHHADPGAGRQRERPAAGPRAGDRLLQPEPGHLEAAPLPDRLPARAAGRLRGRGRVRRQLRLRHRDRPQHQRPAERVPEHRQLPHRRDELQQLLPDRRGREPVRRAAAGNELQQPDHRPLAAAAAVPAVRGHPDDEQRRQVLVPVRPGRRAEALLEGLHAGALLHLLELGAGDGVPEPGRRRADPDDLGPGRAAPAVRQRHLELPFGKGRRFLSDADGFLNGLVGGWQIQGVYTYQSGFPVPFGAYNANTGVTSGDLFYNGGDVAIDDRTTARWFNTDAFTSILNDTATNATPVNHLRTFPYRLDDVRRDSINNIDLSLIKDIELKGDMRLQLRAEFINAFNEAYFPQPVSGATSTTFGQVSASNQSNYARRAQIGVKFIF